MEELTLEEMQEKLKNYCRSVSCDECPFTFRYDCHYIINGDNFAETKEGYDLVFGNKDKDKMKKEFTISDLKNQMVVEVRDGSKYIVVDNYLLSYNSYLDISGYNENLCRKRNSCCSKDFDIMVVFKPVYSLNFENINIDTNIIWQRLEPKKMTKTEIEKELGYEIEIIK